MSRFLNFRLSGNIPGVLARLSLPHPRKRIALSLLITFLVVTLTLGLQKLVFESRFNHVLEAIDIQQSFQGLTLDQTGTGVLLVSIQNRNSMAQVGRIQVFSKVARREQAFDQSFSHSSNLYVSLPVYSQITCQS